MGQPKVLIVDDDTDILMLLALNFEQAGADVTTLENPVLANDLAVSQIKAGKAFDMIVIDIRMPEMNGHQLAKSLRDEGYKGAIVAFTSVATGEGRKEGKEVGITNYLSKDTLSKDLVAAMLSEYCGS